MKFKVRFDPRDIEKKLARVAEEGQKELDAQVLKDSNFYAPEDTGELIASSIRATQIGSGKIIWNTPYARRLFYNPQYKFSRDKNPNAGGLWFNRAKSAHLAGWVKVLKQTTRRNAKG
ncbi:minor capsid protein [Salinithrix halophila]|uniref:Minor capsid protein n=1 Tax=Salinithrix halophila TaxID=1485204 RepID=A0ABV8J8J7_9BACL